MADSEPEQPTRDESSHEDRHHLLHRHHRAEAGEAEEGTEEHEGILDRLRHSGVGTTDPNIVGDAGPFDQPPGMDPEAAEGLGPAGLPLLPPDEEGTAKV
jgi:hypothetical protein